MKFFTVFAAIVAVALASPAEWSLYELTSALQSPQTPEALKPYLQDALNELMSSIMSGSTQNTITVSSPVQDFSSWTLYELSEAIQDPATDPELVVYLEYALNNMMEDLMSGGTPEYAIVATPVGLLPVEPVVVAPLPVPVVTEVAPPAASSPLVQIIVNVKGQAQNPAPVENPTLIPEPVVLPPPVNPIFVPEPVVLPPPVHPVLIPQPVVLPEPVAPEVVVNPVDIIAVNPVGVVNPVDIMHPLPIEG